MDTVSEEESVLRFKKASEFALSGFKVCHCVLKVIKMLRNSGLFWGYPVRKVSPTDAGSGHFKHMHKDNTVH